MRKYRSSEECLSHRSVLSTSFHWQISFTNILWKRLVAWNFDRNIDWWLRIFWILQTSKRNYFFFSVFQVFFFLTFYEYKWCIWLWPLYDNVYTSLWYLYTYISPRLCYFINIDTLPSHAELSCCCFTNKKKFWDKNCANHSDIIITICVGTIIHYTGMSTKFTSFIVFIFVQNDYNLLIK